jgi:DNA-binding response OmpR family regulator
MKARVLIVEDEPDFRQLVEFNLVRQGFDVVSAENGIEALRCARCETPSVILLDLMLPDLDGFSVCEILRSQPATRDVPIIILSALDGPAQRARVAKAKVVGWLKKGVDFESIGECVRSALAEPRATPKARNDSGKQPADLLED